MSLKIAIIPARGGSKRLPGKNIAAGRQTTHLLDNAGRTRQR